MKAVAPAILDKLRKLFALLTSNRDGERAAAMNAIGRVLESNGLDWPDLASAIKKPRRPGNNRRDRPPKATWRTYPLRSMR
jgi:hypothetical protein